MSRTATRRPTTVRTLAGAILTVALIVPVATACGPDSDASATASGTASPAPGTATGVPGAPVPAATTPATAAPATTAPPTLAGAGTTTAASLAPAATTAKPSDTPTPTAKPKSPGRSYPLVDGSTAEVQPVGNQNYTARIVSRGSVLATLETKDADAGLDANDMFVVLSVDGTVHSWMGGAHQGPGTFKLAGGWTAKVTKVGELHYRAQILGLDNAVNDTLDADQHDTGAVANGVYIVLTAGGRIGAHM
ncbi:hypothetical protein [Kitasatospora purpeofusca]|uniref:hypothetical protein n=1 Tax=Kitasatospora purpeofusca TaxID=67352 RepID=UPI002A5A4FB3|nr:hypothetical protein [Kitasatospora purpeofusca]MDY0810739.1 hypothetical protein [Kitasatospora purpeofusca]